MLMLSCCFLLLCPSWCASISCESTPIASSDCMSRLPMAAGATVSRASTSTNSL